MSPSRSSLVVSVALVELGQTKFVLVHLTPKQLTDSKLCAKLTRAIQKKARRPDLPVVFRSVFADEPTRYIGDAQIVRRLKRLALNVSVSDVTVPL